MTTIPRGPWAAYTAIVAFVFTCANAVAAPDAVEETRPPIHNEAGQPLRHADGSPIRYARGDWQAAPRRAVRAAAPAAAAAPAVAASSVPQMRADWSLVAYGSGIGLSGLPSARNGSVTEVYAGGGTGGFGANEYWFALAWNDKTRQFDQVFASEMSLSPIVRLLLARSAGGLQIVAGLENGNLARYDQVSKRLVKGAAGGCISRGGLTALTAADLDKNGTDELLQLCADGALVVQGDGYAGWTLPGVQGNELAVAQLDADPALEIVSTSGAVVDAASHTVQWRYAAGFGAHLRAADLDGNGRAELVVADPWYTIRAFDVQAKKQLWSLQTDQDIGALELADVDGDGRIDLLYGDGQWGSIHVLDPRTRQPMGSFANPEHGTTQIAVVDLNGDGHPDVLWGAGYTSTGSDHLYVGNWARKSIAWQNPDLVGPFLGPLAGDLDGDGVPEIVIASTSSEAGYDSGRIIVLDSRTLAVRAMSPGVIDNFAWTGLRDIALADVDGDGRLEILVAGDRLYDGAIEAWRFDGVGLTRVWQSTPLMSGGPFTRLEFADVDGDGRPEVLGGLSSSEIVAFNPATGAKRWQSPKTGGEIIGLTSGDFDGDGVREIIAAQYNAGAWVLSGKTRAHEATAGALASALARLDGSPLPAFAIGRTDGKATVHRFNGSGYPAVQTLDFGTTVIDGLTPNANGSWWVGAGGVLLQHDGKQTLRASLNYGEGFGRRVLIRGGSNPVLLSAGGPGLRRLPLAP